MPTELINKKKPDNKSKAKSRQVDNINNKVNEVAPSKKKGKQETGYKVKTLRQVHDLVTGRIDALSFANFLDISVAKMSKLLNVSATGLRKNPTSDKHRPTLNRLYIIIDKLQHIFDCSISDVKAWLNAPNPYLDYKAPIDCIFGTDNLEEVEELVDAMEEGGLL